MEITGISAVNVDGNFEWPLIRIDTDEGIAGYGEVRDHGRPYEKGRHAESFYVDDPKDLALDLGPELIGEDPTNVIGRFEDIRGFGGWGRLGGGISGVEMALFDIAGKHFDVPAYQLLGGKYRDEVRIYCDCRAGEPVTDSAVSYKLTENDYTPEGYAEHAAQREAEGFDFLKFDLDPRALEQVSGGAGVRGDHLTEAGLEYLEDVVDALRGAVDKDTDIGFDCASMRSLSIEDAIRFGKVLDDYGISAYEDVTPDRDVSGWTEITEAIQTPTITGEDLYTLDGFRELIRNEAIDLVGPDLLTAGGIRETARIGDFANQHGMPANLHFAASPVGFMASVHSAAAIPNLLAMEFHAIGVPWWGDLVEEGPLFEDGYAEIPDRPGLGVTPNEDAIVEHAKVGETYFD
jgi:L-alanine-DL-glutamate epimerase-like enolase superfamily enzyme